MRRQFALSVLLASVALAPTSVVGQTAEDRQAELARKKAEAKRKAEERAAAKAAAGKAGAGGGSSTTAGGTSASTAGRGGASSGGASATAAGGAGGKGGAGAGGKGGAGGAGGKGGAGGAGGKGGAGGATAKEEKSAPLPAADIETLRKDRPDRRKATVERLRKRWGSLLANEKGASDLKLHARRVAFLQRIRVVAEAKKDAKTIEAVDELLTREDERHAKAMNALREGALPSGTSQ